MFSGLDDIGEHYIIHVSVVWMILDGIILFMFQWFGRYWRALYYSCSSGLADIGKLYIIHVPVVWMILESFILFMFQWFGGYLKGFYIMHV